MYQSPKNSKQNTFMTHLYWAELLSCNDLQICSVVFIFV